jgi:hypothetical protein
VPPVRGDEPDGDVPDTIPPQIKLTGISLFNQNINWHGLEKRKDRTRYLNFKKQNKHNLYNKDKILNSKEINTQIVS